MTDMAAPERPGGAVPKPTARAAPLLPAAPAWYGLTAIGAAAFAALAVSGRPTGLGLALVTVALVATAAAATSPRDRWTDAWFGAAALLALMPAIRTADWVVVLSILGALTLTALAAGRAHAWTRVLTAPVVGVGSLLPGPVLALHAAGRGPSWQVVRGAAVAILLTALFGSLFAAADAAFADFVNGVIPDMDQGAERIYVALLVLAVSGALLAVVALPAATPAEPARTLAGRAETAIALGALIVLFGAFVAVQAATLFGGDAFVRETAGLTYAEYAREGFALLLVVGALTLGVIAAARRWARPDPGLLALLAVLTLVILASAWHRLDLYVEAYGATRAREFAGWSIAWLAGVFVLVLARRTGAPRAVITWSAILGVAFGLSNPDARIATGVKAGDYLDGLSADAAGVTGECVDRGGGFWSLTLAELRHRC